MTVNRCGRYHRHRIDATQTVINLQLFFVLSTKMETTLSVREIDDVGVQANNTRHKKSLVRSGVLPPYCQTLFGSVINISVGPAFNDA